MTDEQVARVCHEANRAYCAGLGDTTQPVWEDAPDWQQRSAVKGVRFHMEQLAKGERPFPADSHNAWLAEKRAEGWQYGPVKDAEKKLHPCFMPYDGLPVEQRTKDYLFAGIVEAFHDAAKNFELPFSATKAG
ncbi:MAG TPA: RyR domain-containing protein [Terracidiphilus sp.]